MTLPDFLFRRHASIFQRLASSALYSFVEIGVYWHFQFITQLSELQSNLCMQILLEKFTLSYSCFSNKGNCGYFLRCICGSKLLLVLFYLRSFPV